MKRMNPGLTFPQTQPNLRCIEGGTSVAQWAACHNWLASATRVSLATWFLLAVGCPGTELGEGADSSLDADAAGHGNDNAQRADDRPTSATSSLVCTGALQDCDGNAENGCETDIFLDSHHCGGCNQPCTHACVDGRCSAPIQLSAGYGTTCALLGTGQVRCWGLNYRGELGNGDGGVEVGDGPVTAWQRLEPPDDDETTPKFTAVPQRVLTGPNTPLTGVTQVASGVYHTCALSVGGRIHCWGANQYGQLGTGRGGASEAYARPVVAIAGTEASANSAFLTGAVQIAASQYGSCAALGDGRVACWGHNNRGQLGLGSEAVSSAVATPQLMRTTSGVVVGGAKTVSVGTGASCVGFERGIACAGAANLLGRGEAAADALELGVVPVLAPAGGTSWNTTVKQLVPWSRGTCVLATSGKISCWLSSIRPEPFLSFPPEVAADQQEVSQLAAKRSHICVRLASGRLMCAANNHYHQLGIATRGDQLHLPGQSSSRLSFVVEPATGAPLAGVIDVTVGETHTCALTDSHQILCWGSNRWGELGRLEPAATGTVRLGELPGEVSWLSE